MNISAVIRNKLIRLRARLRKANWNFKKLHSVIFHDWNYKTKWRTGICALHQLKKSLHCASIHLAFFIAIFHSPRKRKQFMIDILENKFILIMKQMINQGIGMDKSKNDHEMISSVDTERTTT